MSIDYVELRDLATETIKEFGAPCIIRTLGGGNYDVETGGLIQSNGATRQGWCVNESIGFNFGAHGSKGSQRSSAVEVEAGDRIVMVNAETVVLSGDVLTIDGENWRCLSVEANAPASVVLMYTAHLRK